MPAKSRDSGKASKETNLPTRKTAKGRLADRVSRTDFGILQTRPVPPRKRAPSDQRTDSGPPDDIDVPPLIAPAGNRPR